MNISELRSQFTVFVFFPEVDMNAELKQLFVSSGYETYMFIDQELLLDRVRQAAPHVILFSLEVLKSGLSDFIQAVVNANPEVRLICHSPLGATQSLSEYREFNLSQILPSGDFLAQRALWAVDVSCEILALTYQNETLLDQSLKANASSQELAQTVENLKIDLRAHGQGPNVEGLLLQLLKAVSKDEMVVAYLNWFKEREGGGHARCIFFKFLPTVQSFVATQGLGIDLERARGVGAKLVPEELRSLSQLAFERKIPGSLQKLMSEGFGVQDCFVLPLSLKNQIEGLFIFWGIEQASLSTAAWPEFLIFQMTYQNAHYIKRNEGLEIQDPVTDLYNREYFYKKLEEEISRSRRLSRAVSIVKISIDRYAELEKELGTANRDLILRSIATLVKKTSRINDHSCRTADEEIAMILPHCTRMGAALRAERLRKAIESHSFAMNGIHVTVSLGVSEYPTLARYADELDQSSSQALIFIRSRGGNKVCLYKPKEEFKPDFEVSSV